MTETKNTDAKAEVPVVHRYCSKCLTTAESKAEVCFKCFGTDFSTMTFDRGPETPSIIGGNPLPIMGPSPV